MDTVFFLLFYLSAFGIFAFLLYKSKDVYKSFRGKKGGKRKEKREEKISFPDEKEKIWKEKQGAENEEETKEYQKNHENTQEIFSLLKKAEMFIARKEFDDAKKILIKILSWDEGHAEANNHLGFIYLQTKEFTKSEDIYRKALRGKSNDPSTLTNFALSIFQQKIPEKIQESIDALQKAVEIDPHNPERYTNLGQSLFFAGERESALECFEKAVKLSPKNIDFLFFLGDTHLALEEKEKAKKIFEKILEISPFDEEAKKELEELEKNQ